MSIIGDIYDEWLYKNQKELKQAKEYIKDFISILEGESVNSYFANGKTTHIDELKKFVNYEKHSDNY